MRVFLRFQFDTTRSVWVGEVQDQKMELSDSEFQSMTDTILGLKVEPNRTYDLTIGPVTLRGVGSAQITRFKDYFSMLRRSSCLVNSSTV